ncbi:hypothetical protein BST95_19410 (plasmid) [Halioglobus japonicus]|nr:glycosyltransferase domain-containing protein [Halioglobus japonicus]AQA20414.1 hypothetical protein BST95_19410 [Halioglobus japonicus]
MNAEFVCVSEAAAPPGWRGAAPVYQASSAIEINRYHKFFPHEVFPRAEYSIYVDGNIGVIGDLSPLFRAFVDSGRALALFRHRDRQTVAEEIEACLAMAKFDARDKTAHERQTADYAIDGMPDDRPLTDNAVLFRWHRHEALAPAMALWWDHFQTYTKRDQISLPYVVWKTALPTLVWQWSFRQENRYLQKYPHRRHLMRDTRIRMNNLRDRYWGQSKRGDAAVQSADNYL